MLLMVIHFVIYTCRSSLHKLVGLEVPEQFTLQLNRVLDSLLIFELLHPLGISLHALPNVTLNFFVSVIIAFFLTQIIVVTFLVLIL